MGIRSRLKNLLSPRPDSPRPDSPPTASARPPAVAPTATATATPTPAPAPVSPSPAPARGKDDPEVRAKFEKIVAKAKRGVLAHVIETSPDGAMAMADMHDFSERRYFIAHRSFSDLMETWTGEGLVTYDPDTGRVAVTDAGRAFVDQNRK